MAVAAPQSQPSAGNPRPQSKYVVATSWGYTEDYSLDVRCEISSVILILYFSSRSVEHLRINSSNLDSVFVFIT